MAASVRIEDEAFSDGRFEHLGRLLGSTRYDALGRMAYLWKQCTQEGRYVLPIPDVELHVPVDALLASRLGEKCRGGIRIKGTKGRVEWLDKKRKAARLGGLSRAAKAQRVAGQFASHEPATGWADGSATSQPPGQPSASHATSPPAPVTATATAPSSSKKKRARDRPFVPPTVEEVRAYCAERGNDVNPERFVDFYASKGWKVGSQPMKDWKACVRTWENRDRTSPRGNTDATPRPTSGPLRYDPAIHGPVTPLTADERLALRDGSAGEGA